MLLVCCEYCHGTGKQRCPCQIENNGEDKSPTSSTARVILVPEIAKSSWHEAPHGDPQCTLCQDTGEIKCPGCCGSGFVEMPALA